jgi:hypothetical protein
VVAAEFVGRGDGLLERESRVGRAVHAEGGGAACGEDGGGCRGEGEDLCWVGCCRRVLLVRIALRGGMGWRGRFAHLRPPCGR